MPLTQTACGPGTHLEDGDRCVPDPLPQLPQRACGIGTHLMDGVCVLDRLGDQLSGATPWAPNLLAMGSRNVIAAEPTLDVDNHGNIWIAAIIVRPLRPSAIGVARSTDGGVSFDMLRTIEAQSNAYFLGDPTLVIDREDRVVLAWVEYGNQFAIVGQVKVMRTENGVSWSDPQTVELTSTPNFQDRPWLSIGAEGAAYMTWISGTPGGIMSGQKWSRAEGRNPFDAPKSIIPPSSYLVTSPLAFDARDRPVAVGSTREEIHVWRYEDPAWVGVSAASYHAAPGSIDRYAQITSDRAGNLTIVFLNGSGGSVTPSVTRSVDGGRTWSGGMRIDRGFGPRSSAALPWVTTDARGRVHAMWLDNRSGRWTPYTAVSDDGIAFRAPERIGDAGFIEDGALDRWIGDFNALVVKNGRRYAAWTDAREQVSHIYFSVAAEPQ